MSNIGPEYPGSGDHAAGHHGRGNAYRDGAPTGDVQSASARAGAVSHRFGEVRHPLGRPSRPANGGESDARD